MSKVGYASSHLFTDVDNNISVPITKVRMNGCIMFRETYSSARIQIQDLVTSLEGITG